MAHLTGRLFRTQALLAIWISLALVLAPAARAQPAYQDADGRFNLAVPAEFTEEAGITYDMLGDNPLDKLLASDGQAFGEPDTPNGVSVLFLLLDESISDRSEFAGFLAAFQTAAGGQVLPLVDLAFEDGDRLRAAGSAATRERHLQIAVEAQDNVVAILTSSVERARYGDLRAALDEAFNSFTWQPDVVLASLGADLGAEPAPLPPEPESEPEPTAEPEQEPTTEPDQEQDTQQDQKPAPEPTPAPEQEPAPADEPPTDQTEEVPRSEPDAALETERYTSPDGLFTIALPLGLEPSELSDPDQVVHGVGFYAPDDGDIPTLAVAFTPAAFAAENTVGTPDFRALDDDLWNEFIDIFVLSDMEEMTVVTDQRNDLYRTAFLVLEATEPSASPSQDEPEELWVWAEESDGVGAVFIIFGDLDDPANAEIFHSAVTSFAWSPATAATATADLGGVFDPADAPRPLQDPFELIDAYGTPAYPLEAAYFQDDTLKYTFGRDPVDGVFQINLSSPSTRAYSPDDWGIIVDETVASVDATVSGGTLGPNGRLLQREIGRPDVGADNAAAILARTDDYWMLVTMLDRDGVMMTEVVILPDAYWQVHSEAVEAAVEQGVAYDPAAIREALDDNQALGAAVLETGAAADMPLPGDPFDWRNSFAAEDAVTVAIDFAEPGMEGSLRTIILAGDAPNYPLAQFALWLGEEESVSYGKRTSQEETGTRAAFTFYPDYPMNAGDYTAYYYYENELVAANGFTVADSPPDSVDIASFAPAYGDASIGEPLLVTNAVHLDDIVTMRGTISAPAGSQLRLFWYDPDGWLDTGEVSTIRLDSSFTMPYDWLYFAPGVDWQPGLYTYLLTLDGEPFVDGDLFVMPDSPEVELTPDGADLFTALPLPSDIATAPAPDGFNLALAPSDDYIPGNLISAIDAWLRMQGWQPALPSIGAPVAWDYRRWTKDGYQFVMQPGDEGAEDQLWIRYAPLADGALGPLPSGNALDTENLDALAEVALLDVDGLDANHAAVSPDGNWLAVTTTDGTLYIFDALRLLDTIMWQPNAYYANPVFSPDGRDLAVTVQRQLRSDIQLYTNFDVMWLPTTRLNGHTDQITAIDYQSDGWLASGGLDGALRQWEPTGQFLPVMIDADGAVTGVAAAPEEAPGLLVGRAEGLLEYRLDGGEVPWANASTFNTAPQIAVWPSLNANGAGDLAVYGEGPVEWYVYDTGAIDSGIDIPEDDLGFESTGAVFSPNGALLVISGDTVQFYDRAAESWLDEWEILVDGERVSVSSLRMSPDGLYVVIVSDDGFLRLWSAAAQ